MNRWLASHQAISSAPSATSRCGWVSCACTNGVITLSASCGPIRTRTAPLAASSACATGPAPTIVFESPSAEPTAIVEGTSVSTAKNAISAAWPVVRCRLGGAPDLDERAGDPVLGQRLALPPRGGLGPVGDLPQRDAHDPVGAVPADYPPATKGTRWRRNRSVHSTRSPARIVIAPQPRSRAVQAGPRSPIANAAVA